jgi:hypothetical protein
MGSSSSPSSLTRLDLTGVTLESGDSVPSRYVGIGVLVRGVDRVEIVGGTVRGYRYGVRIEGGRGHRVSGMDLSGSRAQALRSTPEKFDETDWLDIFHPDTFETYGGGLLLKFTRCRLSHRDHRPEFPEWHRADRRPGHLRRRQRRLLQLRLGHSPVSVGPERHRAEPGPSQRALRVARLQPGLRLGGPAASGTQWTPTWWRTTTSPTRATGSS